MAKSIIKVNDKLVEFDVDNGDGRDPQYRVLTDQEVTEYYLITKETPHPDEELQNELNEMIRTVTAEMKDSFRTGLKNAVLRMLGFSNSWGRGWEVDNCNQRASIVSQLVTNEMQVFIRDEMNKVKPMLTQEDISSMMNAIRSKFVSDINYTLRDLVHKELNSQLRELVAVEIGKLVAGQELEIKKTALSLMKVEKYKKKKS